VAKDQVESVRDGYSQIAAAITLTMTAPDAGPDLKFLTVLQAAVLAKLHTPPGAQGQMMAGQGASQGGPPGGAPAGPPGGPPSPYTQGPGQGLTPMPPQANADELRALMTRQSGG
jgi:hypothetical protein